MSRLYLYTKYRFYNTSKVQDDYILDKINLFWLGLYHESD